MKTLVDKPKPPFALYRKQKRKYVVTLTKQGTEIWACGECGTLHSQWSAGDDPKQRARECCLQQYCACGNKIGSGYTGPKCGACNSSERSQKVLVKAVEVETFDGPVYDDGADRYWSDIEDFMDYIACQLDDDGDSFPEYVFPCETRAFGGLDADSILESALDEHHEDAYDQLDDVDGLQSLLDQWCEKQNLASWHPDYTRKISVKKLVEHVREDIQGVEDYPAREGG